MSLAGNVPINVPEQSANVLVFFDPDALLAGPRQCCATSGGVSPTIPTSRRPGYRRTPCSISGRAGGRRERWPSICRLDNSLDEVYADSGSATAWLLGSPRSVTVSANIMF